MTLLLITLLVVAVIVVAALLYRDRSYDGIERWHDDLRALRSVTGAGSQVPTDEQAWADAIGSNVRVVSTVPQPRRAPEGLSERGHIGTDVPSDQLRHR
ncbi:MAG: hypothetical protein GEV03_26245 [Streptosporangiales bacterium]|nr:hypothetical protein [Streptosporangiales bacterium]